jgi:tRNA A-37 threonylcarbamoyl transferase component Bud32
MEQFLLRIYFVIQKIIFQQIDQATFDKLISQGKVLEKDCWGIKVVETEDQNIIKIFRLKRVYSSALFFPYACRFRKNAKQLKNKGIKTVDVEKIIYCLAQQRHLLIYKKIPGQSVKALINKSDDAELINQLIKFVVCLHAKGIYFRSLHFGNVIVNNEGDMVLIDIADLKIYPWSLMVNQRIRNWKHLLKYSFEKKIISKYGNERFFDTYAEQAHLTENQTARLKKALID